ncbi:hypothetical protein SPRG_13662 [Saprolegnia parasitica CBS 223.65]|uniref:LamG-like jellyroll fold domain-containing protein n=1 Tax=Saprolegnia parasitica (strain CBS 223.65) TaxID=695850 RepID=A0A067C473_SAPPC|nr:hypothetical protein SPRG_13662 [Saprolegnia parasitica CBS 223.65]KDO21346.1 hypothetical protein SPRG_13662 [Saprolegnia parasitica CBS 223.65]|eukprot:XP_012207905.1 hypothetical protein SPRG_13662 [Saprolegnia parasitica CBS 223.65]
MRALGIAVILGAAYTRSASVMHTVEWNTSALSGLCAYDRLQVQASWSIASAYEPTETAFIGLMHAATGELIRGSDVQLHAKHTSENTKKGSPPGLRCEADPVVCQPDVTTLVVPNRPDGVLQVGDELDLSFSDDTNEPFVATKADLEAILDFPNDFGPAVAGTWVTPRLLRIEILVAPVDDVWIRDIQRSPSVKAFPIAYDAMEVWAYSSVPVTFRVGVAGDYRFVLRLGDHPLLQHASNVVSVDDKAPCETDKVLHSLVLDSATTVRKSSYAIPGILALDGNHSATIPHTSIPTSSTGSWSILMWVYLTQRATDSHQTLLYKGSGSDDHRTPSMWLNPHDQTLMLSVSSRDDMFASISSASALPIGQWVLLGVALANRSADSFDVTLTINGRVDARIHASNATLLPNAGNLYVGGCPWVRGIQGFVSDVRLYADAMPETDVGRLFSSEQAVYFGRGRPAQLRQLTTDTLVSSTMTGTELVGTSTDAFDTDALLDTATSYLFGQRYDGAEYIAAAQDTETATELLHSALQRGDWRAARFLGLVASTSRPGTSYDALSAC